MKRLPHLVLLFVLFLSPGRTQAQTGAVLARFVPGAATGNGRGIAFDGKNLYYTIVGDANIYEVTTTGTLLATIPVAGAVSRGGPLAWDGHALWTMNYSSNSFTLYRVDPKAGSILASCNIATQNPGHPAVTSAPRNIGEFPDGLDWTGSTLWVSSEAFAGNWIAEVNTSCQILAAFQPTVRGGWGSSGVAFDGINLWNAYPVTSQIFQTSIVGTETGLSFAGLVDEDLAIDSVTFAPKCALWANEATFTNNRLTAYEIPQCSSDITTTQFKMPFPASVPSRWRVNSRVDDPSDSYHQGKGYYSIDFRDNVPGQEAPVLAAAGGKVKDAGGTADNVWPSCPSNKSRGMYVVIDHENGFENLYYHLKGGSLLVAKNDAIVTGQVLGMMDSTGCSSGTHLHFQVKYKNSSAQNDKLKIYIEKILMQDYLVGELYPSSNMARPFGAIDVPSANASLSGVANVAGWALDDGGIASLTLLIDGSVSSGIPYGALRSDVCLVYDWPDFDDSCPFVGLEGIFDTRTLTDGKHTLSVLARDNQGNETIIGHRTVFIKNR